jgi:hypothetical protein
VKVSLGKKLPNGNWTTTKKSDPDFVGKAQCLELRGPVFRSSLFYLLLIVKYFSLEGIFPRPLDRGLLNLTKSLFLTKIHHTERVMIDYLVSISISVKKSGDDWRLLIFC